MVCRACGRIIVNENANFCEYCGTATDVNRDGAGSYERTGNESGTGYRANEYRNRAEYTENMYGMKEPFSGQDRTGTPGLAGILNGTAGTAEVENSMSFLHWVVVMMLPYIPLIGMFSYIALLLIWSFGHTASKTRKNWARATLVITLAAIVMVSFMLQSMLGAEGFAQLADSMVSGLY